MPRGSAPGERRGGRQKGTPNKATIDRERKLAEARERILSGITPEQIAAMSPLDIMLQAAQLEAQSGDWKAAAAHAAQAAPYLHPKKASFEVAAPGGGPVQFEVIRRVIIDPKKK